LQLVVNTGLEHIHKDVSELLKLLCKACAIVGHFAEVRSQQERWPTRNNS